MKSAIRASAALVLALAIAAALSLSAFAAGIGTYFDDAAGVISASDAAEISRINDALFALTGAEIAVKTVDSAGGDLYGTAKEIMADNPIGSAERDNGMLLMISSGDNGYWVMPAHGLSEIIGDGEIAAICKDSIEGALASGDCSAAALSFINAMANELASRYGAQLSSWDGSKASFTRAESGSVYPAGMSAKFRYLLLGALGLILLIALIIAAIFIRSKISKDKRRTIRTKRRKSKSTALTFARGINSRRR